MPVADAPQSPSPLCAPFGGYTECIGDCSDYSTITDILLPSERNVRYRSSEASRLTSVSRESMGEIDSQSDVRSYTSSRSRVSTPNAFTASRESDAPDSSTVTYMVSGERSRSRPANLFCEVRLLDY